MPDENDAREPAPEPAPGEDIAADANRALREMMLEMIAPVQILWQAPAEQAEQAGEDEDDYDEDDDEGDPEAFDDVMIPQDPPAPMALKEKLAGLELLREAQPCWRMLSAARETWEILFQAGSKLLFITPNEAPLIQHERGGMWFEVIDPLKERIYHLIREGFFVHLSGGYQELDTRAARLRLAQESIDMTYADFAFWGLRVPEVQTDLAGLCGIQGVESVKLGARRIEVKLKGFTAQFAMPSLPDGEVGWVNCEIDGTFYVDERRVTDVDSYLIFPGQGAYRGLPITNRRGDRGVCLDAGECNFTMAMREGDPVQALLGVLAQLRMLDDNGYTKANDFLAEPQACMGGCRDRVLPSRMLKGRGRKCDACLAPCIACGRDLLEDEVTDTALSGQVHPACATRCPGCHYKIGKGLECPCCGPNPEPARCARCGELSNAEIRRYPSPETGGMMELRCVKCQVQCSSCGSYMATPRRKSLTRCHRCRKCCLVCGKSGGNWMHGIDLHAECTRRCANGLVHYGNSIWFRKDARDKDGQPARHCRSCSARHGFWIPQKRYVEVVEKAQSGAQEASDEQEQTERK